MSILHGRGLHLDQANDAIKSLLNTSIIVNNRLFFYLNFTPDFKKFNTKAATLVGSFLCIKHSFHVKALEE
jgi:hypothetical protein